MTTKQRLVPARIAAQALGWTEEAVRESVERSAWDDLLGVVIGDQCYVFAEELEWRRGRRPCALFVPRHRPFEPA